MKVSMCLVFLKNKKRNIQAMLKRAFCKTRKPKSDGK